MVRALRSLWLWAANITLIVSWALLVGVVRLLDRDPLRRRTARTFRSLGPVMGWVNPWHVKVSGVENMDPAQVYVIVSNHQSLADIPVITHLKLDTKWLAKAELFRVPIFGWMLRMAGDVPVERGDTRKAAKAMLQCARYLRQRCSSCSSRRARARAMAQSCRSTKARSSWPSASRRPRAGSGRLRARAPRNTWMSGGAPTIHLKVPQACAGGGLERQAERALRDAVREIIVPSLPFCCASNDPTETRS